MLTGGKKFSLGRTLAAFLSVDLDDTQTTNRDRFHVRQVTKRRDRNLRFVAVKLHRGVVDRGVTRRRLTIEVLHNIAVCILQRLGQRHGDRLSVDLECDLFFVIALRWRIQPNELSVDIAAEQIFVVVANEQAG